ncbi:MAG TPA: DinB family protein [Ktedonobacteraceae bacterium]|nr:DinB family protein [Ktedonobacteraceae bacterium]
MPAPTSEQLNIYETAPSRVAAAIEGLSEAAMHHKPQAEDWSIHEVIIHLADSETIGFWRLRKTLAEEESTLAVYDEAAWANNLAYHSQNRTLALTLFSALRASTVALLRLLPPEAWERTSLHPERGRMSVYDIFNLYVEHGDVHLHQIQRLKQSLPTSV